VQGDLAAFCLAGAKGELREDLVRFSDGWSVCVILASAGYPETSRNGDVISGLESVTTARVYHSGTKRTADGSWETNGGRVLAIVAGGDNREAAVSQAHATADGVKFDGLQRRRDIGILNF
jgi:phosphoribosylamine---glycine ligase